MNSVTQEDLCGYFVALSQSVCEMQAALDKMLEAVQAFRPMFFENAAFLRESADRFNQSAPDIRLAIVPREGSGVFARLSRRAAKLTKEPLIKTHPIQYRPSRWVIAPRADFDM